MMPMNVEMLRAASLWVVLAALAIVAGGCGGEKATATVTVTEVSGSPIEGAVVTITGTDARATTDATGIARLGGLDTGVYQIRAGQDGYYQDVAQITVPSEGDPEPVSIPLSYVPPMGMWVYQPQSTEWHVLFIASVDPFSAELTRYEWHCILGGWSEDVDEVRLDPSVNALRYGYDEYVRVIGPEEIDQSAFQYALDDPTLIPDSSVNEEPLGACIDGSATWDNRGG